MHLIDQALLSVAVFRDISNMLSAACSAEDLSQVSELYAFSFDAFSEL